MRGKLGISSLGKAIYVELLKSCCYINHSIIAVTVVRNAASE